jgi:hypothetical protein
MEDFTDVVYRAMDGLDPPWGVQCVLLHRFVLQGLMTPGTQKYIRELGPDCGPNSWGLW